MTADTITEDQIRALKAEAAKIVFASGPYALIFPIRERPGVELLYAATYALGEEDPWVAGYEIILPPGASRDEYIAEGRRYCAEFLNLTGEAT
jgi:hypothetical protein